ncbi:MAG TPA: toll/interleukin-1 receptor domain-containing protein [Usitatibacteraceae bacterium]|nr:toll/interleukin-1 receptor domain-containing protein [Usitatibacteraceae bacterium]
MTEARYQAFLSYSHADRKIAQWLHHALETYRVPGRLVGRETPVGKVSERLGRIFKDREELPASGNLGAEIEAALRSSHALIVVCSMAAARSKWVNEEVRNFKRLHGAERVFALIVDGEPFTSEIAGRESDECFPAALRFAVDEAGAVTAARAEPVAADLRAQGDGRRLAVLKLIAGLTGLPLDDLVQREAQRRARRATQIAMAASVLAVAMAALALVAVRARDDARQPRTQAEGLIEFMLVDLRKKLEPVGRLDVLDAVGEKALAHYNAQEGSQLDANSLGHRSRALHLIGEVRQNRGKLSEALAAFERAAETTAELLQRAPDNPQRIFDHAQSVFWVGAVAREQAKRADASRAFLQYYQLARRLVLLAPEKREWQIEPAYAATNVGIALLDDARPADALRYLEESRAIMMRMVPAQPELAFEVAHTVGWISLAHERSGDYARAIEFQQTKRGLFARVPDAAKNRQVQRGLQNAEYEIARLELARGQLQRAKELAIASVASADNMAAADAGNLFWLSERTLARLLLAETQIALGELTNASKTIADTTKDISRLIATDASKPLWTIGLNGTALALAAQCGDDSIPLVEKLTLHAQRLEVLLRSGNRLEPALLVRAAAAQFQLGLILRKRGKSDYAEVHWRKIVDLLKDHEPDSNFHLLTLLARTRLALGERDAAAAIARRIEGSLYRHPGYADLVKELDRGPGPASPNV